MKYIALILFLLASCHKESQKTEAEAYTEYVYISADSAVQNAPDVAFAKERPDTAILGCNLQFASAGTIHRVGISGCSEAMASTIGVRAVRDSLGDRVELSIAFESMR